MRQTNGYRPRPRRGRRARLTRSDTSPPRLRDVIKEAPLVDSGILQVALGAAVLGFVVQGVYPEFRLWGMMLFLFGGVASMLLIWSYCVEWTIIHHQWRQHRRPFIRMHYWIAYIGHLFVWIVMLFLMLGVVAMLMNWTRLLNSW